MATDSRHRTNLDPTEQHFTGKERDTESGNDYFGARYYAQRHGAVHVSPDPSGLLAQNPANPQSWNLYAYVQNNPLINIDPNGLDCVYTSGNSSSVDHNSSSSECGGSEGTWLPGYVDENWVHYNAGTNMWQVASVDGAGKDGTVSYSMFGEGATTRDDGFCVAGCAGADFSQANTNWLQKQLVGNSRLGGIDDYLQFLTGREETVQPGLVKDLSAPLDVSTDHWAGPGGMGPPGGKGDWAASVHDFNFNTNGITIQNTGHYFGLHVSPQTAKMLIQSNNQLIRNAGGVQGIKMGMFFGIVNAFQGYASSWK
jgi:RHS repeat-associated protein